MRIAVYEFHPLEKTLNRAGEIFAETPRSFSKVLLRKKVNGSEEFQFHLHNLACSYVMLVGVLTGCNRESQK